jgi:hypothetical protein
MRIEILAVRRQKRGHSFCDVEVDGTTYYGLHAIVRRSININEPPAYRFSGPLKTAILEALAQWLVVRDGEVAA